MLIYDMVTFVTRSSLVTVLQFKCWMLFCNKIVVVRSDILKYYNIILATSSLASKIKKKWEAYFLIVPCIMLKEVGDNRYLIFAPDALMIAKIKGTAEFRNENTPSIVLITWQFLNQSITPPVIRTLTYAVRLIFIWT